MTVQQLHDADVNYISGVVQSAYSTNAKMPQLTNQSFTGQILGKGSTVSVVSVNDVTITPYVKGTPLVREEVATSVHTLTVDQSDSYDFYVEDIDIATGATQFLDKAGERAGRQFATKIDRYIAGRWAAGAGIDGTTHVGLGTTGTPISLSAAGSAYEYFVNVAALIDDLGPELLAVVHPSVYAKFQLDSRFVGSNQDALYTGQVGEAAGITIIKARVIDPSSSKYKVLFTTDKEALAFASLINKAEAYRPQEDFTNALKGLALYGADVMVPGQVGVGVVTL